MLYQTAAAGRLDKPALIDGFWDSSPPRSVEELSSNWGGDVRRVTDTHGQQILYGELNMAIMAEVTWRHVTDVFGFQLAVRVYSLVQWTPMACASNMNIVLSFAHLPM